MFKDDVKNLLQKIRHYTRELPELVSDAIGAYYSHRIKLFSERSKSDCITDISNAIKGSGTVIGFSAIAGTFYLKWEDGSRTQHNESNWKDCEPLPCKGDLFDNLANASLSRR